MLLDVVTDPRPPLLILGIALGIQGVIVPLLAWLSLTFRLQAAELLLPPRSDEGPIVRRIRRMRRRPWEVLANHQPALTLSETNGYDYMGFENEVNDAVATFRAQIRGPVLRGILAAVRPRAEAKAHAGR